MARFGRPGVILASLVLAAGCAAPADGATSNDALTSNDGEMLEFRFEGEVIADSLLDARHAIVTQLQYAQGILTTAHRANGQVGLVELSEVHETAGAGATNTITYSASLPVAWPKEGHERPSSYELVLPRDLTALDAFNAKYNGICGRDEYGPETFWHDWNPKALDCKIADADVVRARATVVSHPRSTTGKYPEYRRVWEDDALDIVAVFGIVHSNTPTDAGARDMESTLQRVSATLTNPQRSDTGPSESIIKDSTLTGEVVVAGRTRRVTMTALLVQEVASAGRDFDTRFAAATSTADFLVYNGHSGLGANINAFAKKTTVTKDKYQLVYLFGCQTFAYIGTDLFDRKSQLNGKDRDAKGTRDLDVVANALPAYGDDGASVLTLYNALRTYGESPKSYNDILQDFPELHLAAVFGEDDNAPTP